MAREHKIVCETCGAEYIFAVLEDEQAAFFNPESIGWNGDGYGQTWCPEHADDYLAALC